MGSVMFNIMENFVKRKYLMENGHRLEANKFGVLNIRDQSMTKSIHDINTGTKTRQLLAQLEPFESLDIIKTEFKSCYMEILEYLQKRLPHNSIFLRET